MTNLDYNFPTEMRGSACLNVLYHQNYITMLWHMIVTCHNESVKVVTVEEMYKQCGLVCQFHSPEEHWLLVLVYHS